MDVVAAAAKRSTDVLYRAASMALDAKAIAFFMATGTGDAMEDVSDRDIVPIEATELARFHIAFGVETRCSRCGNPKWKLEGDTELPGPILVMGRPDLDPSEFAIPMILLTCTRCGTMWMSAREIVTNWIEANPEKRAMDGQ